MKLKQEKNNVYLYFDYDVDTINKAKMIGMRWSPAKKTWVGKKSYMLAKGLKSAFGLILDGFPYVGPGQSDYSPHPLLMKHQEDGVNTAYENDRHCFFWDCGTGKSLLGIEIIKALDLKTLVLCPLTIIESAWMEDLERFAPELRKRSVSLWNLKGSKLEDAMHKHQVCLINYESFRTKAKLLEEAGFDMVIADESSKVKTFNSGVTKTLIKFTDNIPKVYLLSGTPAPNTRLEYWSQIRMMDVSLLGASFYQFRSKYFQGSGYNGFTFTEKPQKAGELTRLIASVSTVVRKEDVLDLPDRTDMVRYVDLSIKESQVYKEMSKKMIVEIEDNDISASNAAVKLMKLRQITAGFLIGEEGTTTFGNSKLKALINLLNEIGDNQVIIWTQFKHEAVMIQNEIQSALDQQAGICNGTVSQSLKDQTIKAFKNNKIPFLIGHPKSIGHGVTLTNCSYAIYYSLSYSSEEYIQSKDRIYRKGQNNACSYYHMIGSKTIDEVIYKALINKTDVSEAVLKDIQGCK